MMRKQKDNLKGKRHVKWRAPKKAMAHAHVWTQDELVELFLALHEQETGKRIEMIPAAEFFKD